MKLIAVDLGASSGRLIEGNFDGEKLSLIERHRFTNDPVQANGTFFWDTLRIFHEIKKGMHAIQNANPDTHEYSLGIDTWGVDYGWIDKSGKLLTTPIHYRDQRTKGSLSKLDKLFPNNGVYQKTGIQQLELNTINQLLCELENPNNLVDKADKLLFTPDLLNYFLTDIQACEYTIASTSSMLNPYTRQFDTDILKTLKINPSLFAPLRDPCTTLGGLSPGVQEEMGSCHYSVRLVGSHDTASAVLSVPFEEGEEQDIYISSGTWSLMGVESSKPIITNESCEYNLTNEGGIGQTIRFLKNIMGLWILQESRRQWIREGKEYSFAELSAMAKEAKPLRFIINPDDARFGVPGNMPERIVNFCKETNQGEPQTVGEIVRSILDSLALTYRMTANAISEIVGHPSKKIHIVGGGVQDHLLCQLTADACGIPVVAGPIEATACGNLLAQLMASGEIHSIKEARAVIRQSFTNDEYQPGSIHELYNEAYATFLKIRNSNQ